MNLTGSMTTFYIDSCSLIYLKKASILQIFVENFRCVTTLQIFMESKLEKVKFLKVVKAGKNYNKNLEDSLFEVCDMDKNPVFISDDKRFINLCKRHNMKVINSLLVPVILYKFGFLNFEESILAMEKIFDVGFYSQKIYQFALLTLYENTFWKIVAV